MASGGLWRLSAVLCWWALLVGTNQVQLKYVECKRDGLSWRLCFLSNLFSPCLFSWWLGTKKQKVSWFLIRPPIPLIPHLCTHTSSTGLISVLGLHVEGPHTWGSTPLFLEGALLFLLFEKGEDFSWFSAGSGIPVGNIKLCDLATRL